MMEECWRHWRQSHVDKGVIQFSTPALERKVVFPLKTSLTLESLSLKWCLAPSKCAGRVHIVLRVPQMVSITLTTQLRVIKYLHRGKKYIKLGFFFCMISLNTEDVLLSKTPILFMVPMRKWRLGRFGEVSKVQTRWSPRLIPRRTFLFCARGISMRTEMTVLGHL